MARTPIDLKYEIDHETGVVYNRVSGKPIPITEPVMLFRAQDANLPYMLCRYLMLSQDLEHRRAIAINLQRVCEWQAAHPDQVKQPDTVVDEQFTTLFPPERSRLG